MATIQTALKSANASDRRILKKETKSLCPTCCREISASIIQENNSVYMEKACPDHGPFKAMVERDVSLYKTLMNKPAPPARSKISLVIPITQRCNLKCHMCYLPDSGIKDPSLEAIFRIIDNFDGNINFSGGEPTLRHDLSQMVAHAEKQGKRTCVITNGLNLRNKELVDKLADNGLTFCLVSINGLSNSILKQIEGESLLEKKMKALDNLRGTSIKTNLSTSIIQGVNDDRLPELAVFYMKNPDLFTSWRIRTQSAIGRHTEETNLYLSDLLNLVCDALHVNRNELLKTLNSDDSYHGATHLRFDVLSKRGKTPEPLGFRTHVEHTSKAKDLSKYKTLLGPDKKKLLASMSPSQKVKAISSFLFNPSSLRSYSMHIFSWPNAYNIDLEEASQSGMYHVGPGGKPMSFQKAILLNDLKPDWDWEQR